MKPLKKLRATFRRRKPATGGIVRYDPEKPLVLPSGCHWPIDLTKSPIPPEAVILQMRGYTQLTDDERRLFLDTINSLMSRQRFVQASQSQEADLRDAETPPNG